ncbi:MAG: FecR domain-containing protein [Acidobacteriota bacterium]|nr:FecR domain-containing protein [Acidobacteriota bacterium]
MISKSLSRKTLAAFVSVAVLSVYSMVALAGAKVASGELSVSGQVTVNGQKVISGGTLFSGSTVVTANNSTASVSLSKMGRVELSPNSSLILNFTEESVTGMLDKGVAKVSTVAGVSVNIATKDGAVVVDGSQATSFTVSTDRGNTVVSTEAGLAELRSGTSSQQIAAGDNGTAGTPNPQTTDDDDDDMSGGALAVLLLATAGAVIAIIIAAKEDNELEVGGNPVVISPSR